MPVDDEEAPPGAWRTVVAMALATHLGPTVAVTSVAALLAVAADVGAARTALVALAVLAGQASIGWSNDWLDADRDAAVARADKPTVQGLVTPARLRAAALTAVVVAVVASLALGPAPGVLLLGVVAGGWAYNAGLKRTAASLLPYLVAFGLLPAGVVAAAPGTPVAPWWLVAAGALLGGAAHLANVAPDLEDDAATGVRGLPHRLGARTSALVAAGLLGAASLVLVLGPAGPPTVLGWLALVVAVPALVVAGLAGSERFRAAAFPAVMLLTVVDVVLLVLGGSALQ
ncbi:4-hydroxybenzoate polyprenyltransferase [Klenkia marina]|uniref:4-hydroxybenzoate polyprenyltransferase n=1 Tax=Klenkia marina TaxID=1960309 RepID=A0A1G4XDK3_9ACTN|nr:UbiA family prenyltransferase [Klenkia marina]SCX39257.1 4-hydroxybenzoate polyprenyltransferase [Klenkia marina]